MAEALRVSPAALAIFLMLALSGAGVAQVAWLRSAASRALTQPLDMGLTLRGRRLLGDNKTLRGFVVMVPASGLAFGLGALAMGEGPWDLPAAGHAALGLAAGLGFMLGELPNSFLKRQLDVPPGEAPASRPMRALSLALDRCDSILGALLALTLLAPVPAATWLWCLLVGPGVHAVFSLALHLVGVKRRPG